MARVFLSYARDDEARAKDIADALAHAGHEVWWHRHIHGGSRFATEIELALKNAEVVVILWSATSVKSAWVQDEAAEGRDRGCLVPVSLDESKPPLGFRQYQSIDFSGQNGKPDAASTESLLRAIAQTMGNNDAAMAYHPGLQESLKPKPSVCVLPFLNIGGDPEQEYFSDGITEDIITDLSKVSALSIVARNTAFNSKARKLTFRNSVAR